MKSAGPRGLRGLAALVLLGLAPWVWGFGGTFDGMRAFAHVKRVVDLGPRPAGSPASAACRRYIRSQVEALGLKLEERPFDAQTPFGKVPMVNLVVRLPGTRSETIVIGGHYDTKLFLTGRPFVGANDGGSSTGFLLELLRAMKRLRHEMALEVVFFDGEEAFVAWEGLDHTYGSRAYVEAAKREGRLASLRAMILVDMIGDGDLDIRKDQNSTPWMTELVWASARRLNLGRCFLEEFAAVEDDHRPFLDAGVPAVDLIDLDYSPWHTPGDTLDKISPGSLQVVGDVLLDALPKIERHLQKAR